jgi:hypothetical protein
MNVLCTFLFENCVCQVIQQWQVKYIGPTGGDHLNSMCIDNLGNVYITGESRGVKTYTDYATVKYSTLGNEQWVARYSGGTGTGNTLACAFAVTVDRFGNIYVTGYAPPPGNYTQQKYTTIKYNPYGIQKWMIVYFGTLQAVNVAYSIANDYDANIYVTGSSCFDTTGYDFTTIKYDSSGNEKWVARYRNPGQDWAKKVVVDNSGNVYVTGNINVDSTYGDIATVKYNSLGVQQWATIFNSPGYRGDTVTSLAVDDYGNVYIAGTTWGSLVTSYDYVTVKYNSSGVQQWATLYNGTGNRNDIANSLIVDDSGNVYVTGQALNSTNGYDCISIKYNSSGVQQWLARYNYTGNDDRGRSITLDKFGCVYVAASSWAGVMGSRNDFATIKYSPSGEQLWVIKTSQSWDEVPVKIAVDSLGNVYVAGNDGNYLTIKYNQVVGIKPILNEISNNYKLYQNFPNPFNTSTNIRFDIAKAGNVKLTIYDVTGRMVKVITDSKFEAGSHMVEFNGDNFTSGIYFYKLVVDSYVETEGFIETKKMMLIK